MEQYAIWQRTLAPQGDGLDSQRTILSQAFLDFRRQVKHLVGEIAGLLPDLTVHDITHLDALWRIADQIAGPDYPLNPAEAFVLGGAFLLHDAAHVLAAYEKRLESVKECIEWKDLVAQQFDGDEPITGSTEERFALFQVLRQLHASQAHKLPKINWKIPGSNDRLYLISNYQIREYYGDQIGEIAESHHWPTHRLVDEFENRIIGAPGFLAPAIWEIDVLKIAFLLRTADAAHIDGQRAPWFLFALRQPQSISASHWRFQAKMAQPTRTADGELRLSSGSPFSLQERQAWWLAYDTARMIDRELRDAKAMMRDADRAQFAAVGVSHVATPSSFSANVRTSGWEPIHVEPAIRDVSKVIANFGGAKLYGNNPELALRELIQNGVDATNALRTMGQIAPLEGGIEIALEYKDDQCWLHITDQGIGMSRHVLTEVLPDFGNSLWSNELVRSEIPGLASKGFKAIGQFGIGFYSVFMLGTHVRVTTRRFRKSSNDSSDQWILEFENSLSGRPILRKPKEQEELQRAGTRVSVAIDLTTLKKLVAANHDVWQIEGLPQFGEANKTGLVGRFVGKKNTIEIVNFGLIVANLCPTLNIAVSVRIGSQPVIKVVKPNDWQTIPSNELNARLYIRTGSFRPDNLESALVDLREKSGELVGRVRYAKDYFARAHATHRGIRNGIIPNVTGIVLSHNNVDLARSEARPIASLTAWKTWAAQSIESANAKDIKMMLTLHPLCPDCDLPVYEMGGKFFTEAALCTWLASVVEIKTHAGRPEYEDEDDMSESKFDNWLELPEEILFYPEHTSVLSKALDIPQIDYAARLQQMLYEVWKKFDEEEVDNEVVGDVDGTEITRSIFVYTKTNVVAVE